MIIRCCPARLVSVSVFCFAKSLIANSYALSGSQTSGDSTAIVPVKVRGKTPMIV
jgi:hypothetical protein